MRDAVDSATGKMRWSFQVVQHDLWDYDMRPSRWQPRRSAACLRVLSEARTWGFTPLDQLW